MQYTHKVTQKPSPETSTDCWKKRALQTSCCTKMGVSHTHGGYWWALREGESWQTPAGSWGWGSSPSVGCWSQGQQRQVPRGSMFWVLLPSLFLKLDQQANPACQQGLLEGYYLLLNICGNASLSLKASEGSSCLALKDVWCFRRGSRHIAVKICGKAMGSNQVSLPCS